MEHSDGCDHSQFVAKTEDGAVVCIPCMIRAKEKEARKTAMQNVIDN